MSQSDWKPIRLKDIEEARKQGKELPHNAILLTFDDGALSSYSRIFPLLKQYRIPAVLHSQPVGLTVIQKLAMKPMDKGT